MERSFAFHQNRGIQDVVQRFY